MNKVEILGAAAIEYAAQQVVTERTAAKELKTKLDAALAELELARQSDLYEKRYDAELRQNERRSRAFLERVREDMEKIDRAPFWRRRTMLRDLIQKAYWV